MTKKIIPKNKRNNKIEMIGKNFGRLTVIAEAGSSKGKKLLYKCECSCGNIRIIHGCCLRSGHTKSCGCLSQERKTTHGMWNSSEYKIWEAIIQRCTNEKSTKYEYYGGRGIKVCPQWLKFANFFKDMGKRPLKHEIDRKNNDGNYEPSNCRWATRSEQMRNSRTSIKNTSGIRGVIWNKINQKYRARIGIHGKDIHLGYFKTITEATEARKVGEAKHWQEKR